MSLMVSNFQGLSNEELKQLFSVYGSVSVIFTGEEAMFTFSYKEDARKAYESLKNFDIGGRRTLVITLLFKL